MYNGIGLQTPRGSGTNGYIQTNKFFVKPRTAPARVDYSGADGDGPKPDAPMRKPNKEILEHSRKRQIELRLMQLQEKLEAQGYTEAEMEEKLQQARKDFEAESAAATAAEEAGVGRGRPPLPNNRFADSQSHRSAALKEKQLEIFRAALDSGDQRRVRHDRREDSDKRGFIGDRSNEEKRRYEFNQQKDDKNIINLKHKGSGDNSTGKSAEGRIDKHGSDTRQNDPEDTSDLRDNMKRGNNIKDKKSDYSDSDRDSGDSARKKLSKHSRKHTRHDIDSDSDFSNHQKRKGQKNKKSMSAVSQKQRKSDKYNESDYSDSDSDSDHGATKEEAKYDKKYNRRDIDLDSDGAKHKKRENKSNDTDLTIKRGSKIKSHKEHAMKPKRYDTDSDSEGAKYKKNVISNNKSKKSSKKKSQYSGSESYSSDSSIRERTKHAKQKRYAHYSDSDSDTNPDSESEVAKNKNKDIRNTKKSMISVLRKRGKSIGSEESDYISSGSDDDKHVAKYRRYDSDSEGDRKKNRDIRGSQKNTVNVAKTQGKSNKYDKSCSSESESDSGDETRREMVQHVSKETRYDPNLDSLDAKHKKELTERKGSKNRKYNSEDSDLDADDEKNRRGLEKPSGSSKIPKSMDSMNERGKKDGLNGMKYGKGRRHYSDSASSDDSEDKRQKSREKDITVKREHISISNKVERNTQIESRQGNKDIYDPRKSKTEGGKDTAEGERWKEMGSKNIQNDGYDRSQRREDYAKRFSDSRAMIHEDEHAGRKRARHEQRYHDVRDHETRKREDNEKDMSDRRAMRHEDDIINRKRSRIDNSYEDKKRRYEGSPRHERYEHHKAEGTRHHDMRDASRRHRD